MHHSLSGSSNSRLLLNLLGSQVFARYHQMVVMRFVHTADLFFPFCHVSLSRTYKDVQMKLENGVRLVKVKQKQVWPRSLRQSEATMKFQNDCCNNE